MRSLTPIYDIAESVAVVNLGDSTKKYMVLLLEAMSDCYREMHLFMSDTFAVKTEIMPASRVVEMPEDFIEPTKVAIKIGDRVAVLWRDYGSFGKQNHPNPNMTDLDYLQGIINGSIIPNEIIPFYNYMGTNILDGFTTGIDPSGFYTFDRNTGTIQLGSLWPDTAEVVVEYKSDGVSGGLILVPTEWMTALKEYAMWKYWTKMRDRVQANIHKNEYLTQYYMVKEMYVQQPIDYQSRVFQNTPRQTINNLL